MQNFYHISRTLKWPTKREKKEGKIYSTIEGGMVRNKEEKESFTYWFDLRICITPLA